MGAEGVGAGWEAAGGVQYFIASKPAAGSTVWACVGAQVCESRPPRPPHPAARVCMLWLRGVWPAHLEGVDEQLVAGGYLILGHPSAGQGQAGMRREACAGRQVQGGRHVQGGSGQAA